MVKIFLHNHSNQTSLDWFWGWTNILKCWLNWTIYKNKKYSISQFWLQSHSNPILLHITTSSFYQTSGTLIIISIIFTCLLYFLLFSAKWSHYILFLVPSLSWHRCMKPSRCPHCLLDWWLQQWCHTWSSVDTNLLTSSLIIHTLWLWWLAVRATWTLLVKDVWLSDSRWYFAVCVWSI